MTRSISRATISSLKATKTAHQLANEILNPHIPQPIKELPKQWVPSQAPALPPMHLSLPPIEWPFTDESIDRPTAVQAPQARPTKVNGFLEDHEQLMWVGLIVLSVIITLASIFYVTAHM